MTAPAQRWFELEIVAGRGLLNHPTHSAGAMPAFVRLTDRNEKPVEIRFGPSRPAYGYEGTVFAFGDHSTATIRIDSGRNPGPWRLVTVSDHGPQIKLVADADDLVMYLSTSLSSFAAHGIKT